MKYTGSFADVVVGKTATGGFTKKSFKTIEEFAKQALKQAWIPVTVKTGWRTYDNVTEVHNWLRFDCDVEGEKETICSILRSRKIAYMALPSTNYNPKTKSYKWHISVPTKKAAQDVAQYKQQIKEALVDLGIDLHDRRVTEVCVQNMNPYHNGDKPKLGMSYVEFNEGEIYKLPKRDKSIQYNSMNKTIFNGRGSNTVINKKVVKATDNYQELSPSSGIKVDGVGWTTLGSLNLEVGGIIGGLSCPAHNTRHNNGKGAHQCGYAFATMNEGGDVWIKCTGAECKGMSYKMAQEDFGAHTKLSDLYEIRRLVSLSGFDFKGNNVMYINDKNIPTYFRFKDMKKFWGSEIFFKLDTDLSAEARDKIDAVIKKRIVEHEKTFNIDYSKLTVEEEAESKELLLRGGFHSESEIEALYQKHRSYRKVSVVLNAESLAGLDTAPIIEADMWGKIKEAMGSEYAYNIFYKKYKDHDDKWMGYVEDIIQNITNHLQTQRQFNDIEYKTNPYLAHTIGTIENGNMIITFNRMASIKLPHETPEQKYIDDYKEHNPYLDDIIDMIITQEFGADKKSSYCWVNCSSDWGKSFLFNGVFGNLAYELSTDEIKMAIKGQPSGIDINSLVKASCIVVDEFKGAVSEIKNITHGISVTPKNRGKYLIPVGMKFFASAESVGSLVGTDGVMEAQFRNRFLYIKASGSLIERGLYAENKAMYFKAIQSYVRSRVYELVQKYMSWGDVIGARRADKRYQELVELYTIKKDTIVLDDALEGMFKEWVSTVSSRENIKDMIEPYWYKGCMIFQPKTNLVYINNKALAVDFFVNDFVPKQQQAMVRHKDVNVIIGDVKRANIKVDDIPRSGYRLPY